MFDIWSDNITNAKDMDSYIYAFNMKYKNKVDCDGDLIVHFNKQLLVASTSDPIEFSFGTDTWKELTKKLIKYFYIEE